MSAEPTPFPVRPMRIALVLGALVDMTGGLPLVFAPEATAQWLGTPVSATQHFWPYYSSVFLFVLPCFYLIGAVDPVRHIGIVIGGILGRLMGAAFYAAWFAFHLPERHWPLLVLSILNLLFALYTAGALGPQGRTLIRGALRSSPS